MFSRIICSAFTYLFINKAFCQKLLFKHSYQQNLIGRKRPRQAAVGMFRMLTLLQCIETHAGLTSSYTLIMYIILHFLFFEKGTILADYSL